MFRRPSARARSSEGPSPWPRRSRDRRGHRTQDCRPGRRASGSCRAFIAETSEASELTLGSAASLVSIVADRLAGVAERRVQRADGGVDGCGLAIPGDDQSLAAVRQKILGQRVDPARVDTRDGCLPALRGSQARQDVRRAPRGRGRSAGSRDGAGDPPWLPSARRPLQQRRAGSSRHPRLPRVFRPRSLARDGSSRGRSGADRRRARG